MRDKRKPRRRIRPFNRFYYRTVQPEIERWKPIFPSDAQYEAIAKAKPSVFQVLERKHGD